MKELTYQYDGKNVRTAKIDGEVFFRLSDVGSILELTNPYRYDFVKKGSHTVTTLTNGGSQEVIFINEAAMYRLIFKSRKEEAKQFQDWVFEIVLPSIRKTGRYSIPKEIRQESTEKRKELTDAWKESGVSRPWEYGALTNESYNQLGFEKGIKKSEMDKGQIMALLALETLEKVNLYFNKKHGYLECKDSLKATSKVIVKYLEDK